MVARDPNRGIIPGCLVSYAVRLTDQVRMSRTPGSFNTVLVPRGSSKPEWLG
jgi:hypothetical protein